MAAALKSGAGILIPKHGGYRKLKSFQLAQLVYDLTVRFCDRYIDKYSRTNDQMVQAARSGVQNIAEGSLASGTSKKTELKLTNVARASLEELKLDYEDYLRQRGFALWADDDPRRKELLQRRCQTAEEVAEWVKELRSRERKAQDGQARQGLPDGQNGQDGRDGHNGQCAETPGMSISSISSISSIKPIAATSSPELPISQYSELAANAALVLIGVACAMLDRQIRALAEAFTQEDGFTEKLYKTRQQHRK
ncbi:MAG: four helix bundle protein [Candidatus Cloacimonetes bacterium HGW-Cloacimonetes-2]|jgi:four helix bundle suffix protein|nr:MAG: four helix bundle protein [Candidatus Cloacimonetes bacterium HGW-Cloacimonetes-2]